MRRVTGMLGVVAVVLMTAGVVAQTKPSFAGEWKKVVWAGNDLVVTTTTGAGDERRTFAMDGDALVVQTSTPARNGTAASVSKVTYKKYQRGFGG